MSASQSVFPLTPLNAVVHRGIVPSMCTVAANSFSSNSSYGSGAAQVGSYAGVVLTQKSSSAIRQHDNEVQVNINLVLDLSLANPIPSPSGDDGEVRILPGLVGQPATPSNWQQVLPTPDPSYGLPVLQGVQIIDVNTAAGTYVPVNLAGNIQAQLLYGGNLALILVDPTTNAITPLTAADLAALFGVVNHQLVIKVQGTYRGYSSPN
jgi:hypothetical protein